MRIAVCDDEALQCESLAKQIWSCRQLCGDNGLDICVDEYESGEALVAAYEQGVRYDIVFSDIRMKKTDGMTAAEQLRKMDNRVILIMVTSFIDYAIQGYDLRIFRYLLKPVTNDRFRAVFADALTELNSLSRRGYIIKSREEGNIIVPFEEISYFESFGRKVCLVKENGQNNEFYASVGDLEDELSAHNFVRIHKSYLVNVEKVRGISKTEVTMTSGVKLPLSSKRYSAVWERVSEFVLR